MSKAVSNVNFECLPQSLSWEWVCHWYTFNEAHLSIIAIELIGNYLSIRKGWHEIQALDMEVCVCRVLTCWTVNRSINNFSMGDSKRRKKFTTHESVDPKKFTHEHSLSVIHQCVKNFQTKRKKINILKQLSNHNLMPKRPAWGRWRRLICVKGNAPEAYEGNSKGFSLVFRVIEVLSAE